MWGVTLCEWVRLALPNISNEIWGEFFLDSMTLFDNEALHSFKMGNQWRSDRVSQPGIPKPSKWLWKPQNSHTSPHSQELAAGLCHEPDKSTQPVYHHFTTLLKPTLRSLKYLFLSALYPPFCTYLSPPQVFHAQNTPSSLHQAMKTTTHEDPYHMSQFKLFQLFSPLTNVHLGR